MENKFRNLPSVDKLLSYDRIKRIRDIYPHELVADLISQRLEQERASIAEGKAKYGTQTGSAKK